MDGYYSSTTSGVLQGFILAPLLFLCFINDLPEGTKSRIKLYADDVLLYSTYIQPSHHWTIVTNYKLIQITLEWMGKKVEHNI